MYQESVPNFERTSLHANELLELYNMTKDTTDYLWYTTRYQKFPVILFFFTSVSHNLLSPVTYTWTSFYSNYEAEKMFLIILLIWFGAEKYDHWFTSNILNLCLILIYCRFTLEGEKWAVLHISSLGHALHAFVNGIYIGKTLFELWPNHIYKGITCLNKKIIYCTHFSIYEIFENA